MLEHNSSAKAKQHMLAYSEEHNNCTVCRNIPMYWFVP